MSVAAGSLWPGPSRGRMSVRGGMVRFKHAASRDKYTRRVISDFAELKASAKFSTPLLVVFPFLWDFQRLEGVSSSSTICLKLGNMRTVSLVLPKRQNASVNCTPESNYSLNPSIPSSTSHCCCLSFPRPMNHIRDRTQSNPYPVRPNSQAHF